MSKAKRALALRVLQLACRFGLGFLIGLTTLIAVVVVGMLVMVFRRVPYGPLIAVVSGCSVSGLLYMAVLWAYKGDYGEPPKKKKLPKGD